MTAFKKKHTHKQNCGGQSSISFGYVPLVTEKEGCDGRPGSGKEVDKCGECGGDDSTCKDCNGEGQKHAYIQPIQRIRRHLDNFDDDDIDNDIDNFDNNNNNNNKRDNLDKRKK